MSAAFVEEKREIDEQSIRKGAIYDEQEAHLVVQLPPQLANLTPEELEAVDKRATRKVDILLLPTLFILYVLNYLDRQNISIAKIGGLTEDLGLTAQQFSTCVAVLFAGYVALQVPSNMVANRVPWPSIYICIMCALWGIVSACTGVVQSYAGLAVCRTMLGFTESAFFPGALYLLSIFYTKKQLAFRTAILYSGSQIGNAFGGLFALAILELDGAHGLEGWRWLFIIEGAATVGIAFIFMLFMPNKPETMRWVTDTERAQLVYRLSVDRGTNDNSEEVPIKHALYAALTDIKVWMVVVALTVCYIATAVTNFFPVVVNGLNFNRTTTLAITAPPYILAIFCISFNGWHSDKTGERAFHIICPFFITIVANVLAVATTNTAARYTAMMLMPGSFYASSIVLLSWISTSVTGSHAKRAIAIALVNSVSNTSNIWTSYLYTNAPRYVLAFAVNLGAAVVFIILIALLRWYLASLNKKLDRGEDLGIHGPTKVQQEAGFRFML